MKFRHLLFLTFCAASLLCSTCVHATPTTSAGSGTTKQPRELAKRVGITELKIEMAESRLKLTPGSDAIGDLIMSLEDFLNTSCLTKLPQTLAYAGNPSDPTCIARMQRILEVNPGNPVGLCVRDGITAQSCVEAYRNQKLEPFYSGNSRKDVDPALKVGLSAADVERITKLEESLANINKRYQEATSEEEKRALIQDAANVYDQSLTIACKVTSLVLKPTSNTQGDLEPLEVAQAREKLLQVPTAIRGDYQREMAEKAQKEFAAAALSSERREVLTLLLKVIEDPTSVPPQKAVDTTRVRIVLSKCYDLIEQASRATPDSPSPTCYREGWYSPQCILALKRSRALQRQAEAAARGTPVSTPSAITRF